MIRRADVLVIGGGPAGSGAALEAAAAGLGVLLVDEAAQPGGQVYRASPIEFQADPAASGDHDQRAGDLLRAAVADSTVTWLGGRRVWTVSGRFRLDALAPGGNESYEAPRLVAATGAHERVIPFPGWTLPGVIGLAGASILLKSQVMLPARRLVVAGCGPLLLAVAAKAASCGCEIAAIVDLASPAAWLRALPKLAARPASLAEGIGWVLSLGRRRVPVMFRHTVIRAEGSDGLERVVVAPVNDQGVPIPAGRERTIETGCLTVGHGLVAGAEVTRQLQARHTFDRLRGGWVPVTDGMGRTSIEGLYAAGDGAGIAGAAPATASGRLAGLAAAMDAGAVSRTDARRKTALLAQRRHAMAFGNAMAEMMVVRPGQIDAIAEQAVVCRCEDVTRGEIEEAIAAGAREVNQLKHFTRCGMGPCQGRMCGDVVAELVARHVAGREAAGQWTGRPPLRPVQLDALVGQFTYDDIPVPTPAPL